MSKNLIQKSVIILAVLFVAFGAVRAQQVTPRVCVETTYYSGTTTLAQAASAGQKIITVNGYIPPFVAVTINPGGATEERFDYVNVRIDGSGPYTISINPSFAYALNTSNFNNQALSYALGFAHSAGEIVRFEGYSGTASFGYRNAGNSTVTIPRSVTSFNFFTPGPTTYSGQPSQFQPGIYENVLVLPFGGKSGDTLSWVIGSAGPNNVATAGINQNQGCARITYQGRLTDGGTAVNGVYDLRLTAFDVASGGAAQSASVVVEDATVTNGIFTVYPNFGASFANSQSARFLEIAVRAGSSTGEFTTLQPRQPITSVPYAISAQYAANAANATNAAHLNGVAANQYVLTTDPRLSATNNANFIQNTTTQQIGNFNISGNGAIGGNLNISGAITSGCRAGFTAIAGGRLCVSAMQSPALFVVAVENCKAMNARVGNSADAMLTFSQQGFNYFGNLSQGWLADNMGNRQWGTWSVSTPNADFAGAPAANGIGGNGPTLPFRCVY